MFIIPSLSFGACNWKTGVIKTEKGFLYTKSCHKAVGKMKEDVADREEQVKKLNESISLKDLALTKAEERAKNWSDESYNQYERLQRQARLNSYNNWIYFGGGIAVTILSVWAAGQIR